MSATTAPTVALNVTESAATEIKKFMARRRRACPKLQDSA